MAVRKTLKTRAAKAALSWLRLPEPRSFAPAVQKLHAESVQAFGFVRNVLKLPFGPDRLPLFQGYLDRLMRSEDAVLAPRERELLALVTSVQNRCEVCVVTHANALRRYGMDKDLLDVLTINWRRADLSPRERALAEFATLLTDLPAEADESYIDILRDAGLSEAQILEAVQIVAIYNFSNRLNSGLGIKLNPEAHAAYRSA
jgi:uncharacterized peroxidase-related enzyme